MAPLTAVEIVDKLLDVLVGSNITAHLYIGMEEILFTDWWEDLFPGERDQLHRQLIDIVESSVDNVLDSYR